MPLHCLLAGTEADWIRRAGVLVAIIGTGAAAPDGVSFGSRWTRNKTRQATRWGWVRLARFLPRLRRSATVQGVTAHGSVRMPPLSMQGNVLKWYPDASERTLVNLLHEQMVDAYKEIEKVRQEARADDEKLRRMVEDRVGELQASNRELRELLKAREHRSARVDSRGVLLIGLSIIMTGVPDGLARFNWVGWLVVAGALTAIVVIV